MGAQFEQLKGGQETLDKCIEAVKQAYFAEPWLEPLIKSAKQAGRFHRGSVVLLSWWKNIKQTNVNWEYWLTSKNANEIKFEYQDYTGKSIYIYERDGKSVVARDKVVGFSEDVVNKLDGLTIDEFEKEKDATLLKYCGTDDTELKITETI